MDGEKIEECVIHGKYVGENCPECGDPILPTAPREADLHILPVWKAGLTAEEWFQDMALQARKHPDRFQKMILVYSITKPNGNIETHYYCYNAATDALIGMLEIGKQEVLSFVYRGARK